MQEQETRQTCPVCGASVAWGAGFCAVCGSVLLEERRLEEHPLDVETRMSGGVSPQDPASTEAGGTWEGAPLVPPPSLAADAAPTLPPMPTEAEAQKRCSWCSAINPQDVAVCEACGARFPVPEQDEALRRFSEQRVQAEESSVEQMRQRRMRRLGWGIFRRWF